MRAIFLDRDGTINIEPSDEVVDEKNKIRLFPETIEALSQLAQKNYQIFIVTNQIGIAKGQLSDEQFHEINNEILNRLSPSGIKIEKTYYCPHAVEDNCDCRKPKTGMIKQAMANYEIDLPNSYVIGERETDVQLGKNVGAKTILVNRSSVTMNTKPDYIVKDLKEAMDQIA